MKTTDWQQLLIRDSYCLHCGETEALSPNHRQNRGMGGSKLADVPSNIVLLCSWMNERIEGSAFFRDMAIENGWKVGKWTDWRSVPVFDACSGEWWILNDDWTRTLTENSQTS